MSSVSAIIDARFPPQATEKLRSHCEVFLFSSSGITYDAIACHPDVFMFQGSRGLIVAPNAPGSLLYFLRKRQIAVSLGHTPVGHSLRNSSRYNCIETSSNLFHKAGFTDGSILQAVAAPLVALPQAYTRCSMFALNSKAFITSDRGIEKALVKQGFSCLYCSPGNIVLPPYKHGFIGGCLGAYQQNLFVSGNLCTLPEGQQLRDFARRHGFSVTELHDGNLYDGGGIFFV